MTDFLSPHISFDDKTQIPFSILKLGDTPKISRQLFTKTRYSRRDYTELELFRQQIELNQQGLHHEPYTVNKYGVKLYKSIFYGFAAVFVLLGIFVIASNSTISYAFFNISIVLKSFISLICGLLSFASFIIAYTMRTEREAIMHYTHAAKANLTKLYTRRKMKLGFKRFLTYFGHNFEEADSIKQTYHDACDKITEHKEEALHLVGRINSSTSMEAHTKELLYNQAIAQFNDKLILLVRNFKL